MTWNPDQNIGYELAKIASIAVPYLQGRFLDLGSGNSPVWPSAICIDDHSASLIGTTGIKTDISDLSMFTDNSMDACSSSHALEDLPLSKVPAVLKEWWRVLKVGGHLVLYLPHPDHYPRVGQPGCNAAHQWDPTPEVILKIMEGIGSWTLLENEIRSGTNEYSFFQCFRRDE